MAVELTYRVPSLTVPELRELATPEILLTYEGVRLFVDRARLAAALHDHQGQRTGHRINLFAP
jgi:hypothetical protein